MKKVVCENYEHLSLVAADLTARQIAAKPNSVIGLPAGTTPIGMYRNLIHRYNRMETDFKNVSLFCLEEYYGMPYLSDKTYGYFLGVQFFDHVNIGVENVHLPNSGAADAEGECRRFDELLDAVGDIDLQILGVGANGHIGAIFPAETLPLRTHTVKLDNKMREESPEMVLAMGIADVFKAKKIILLISGAGKASIAKRFFSEGMSTMCPVSLLHLHRDLTVILDKEAMGQIEN